MNQKPIICCGYFQDGVPLHIGKIVKCSCGCNRTLYVTNVSIEKSGYPESEITYICFEEIVRIIERNNANKKRTQLVLPDMKDVDALKEEYRKMNINN